MSLPLRSYRRRNKLIELEEIPDAVAVRGVASTAKLSGLDGQDAFERGGWSFLRKSELATAARPGSAVARVFRKRNTGQLVLNLNRATIKFKSGIARDEIERTLTAHGAEDIRPLPIADNLFAFVLSSDRDVFATVTELSELPDVEFAEPDLVEAIGAR